MLGGGEAIILLIGQVSSHTGHRTKPSERSPLRIFCSLPASVSRGGLFDDLMPTRANGSVNREIILALVCVDFVYRERNINLMLMAHFSSVIFCPHSDVLSNCFTISSSISRQSVATQNRKKMKFSTALKFMGLGPAFLSSQGGVEATSGVSVL